MKFITFAKKTREIFLLVNDLNSTDCERGPQVKELHVLALSKEKAEEPYYR